VLQDVFVERIVKKKTGVGTVFLKIGIILLSIVLAAVLILAGMLFIPQFISFALLLGCGLIYLAYILATSFNVEFETCFTNGSFDVDKIINRRKRKRLISLRCKDVESIGRYKSVDHANKQYKTRIIACSSEDAEDVWYLTLRHNTLGHTLVVFNADERLLNGLKDFIPRQLAFQVFNKR